MKTRKKENEKYEANPIAEAMNIIFAALAGDDVVVRHLDNGVEELEVTFPPDRKEAKGGGEDVDG